MSSMTLNALKVANAFVSLSPALGRTSSHRWVQGASQGVPQRAHGIGFDDDRYPVAFLGHAVRLPQQDCPSFTTQAMQDD